MNRQKPNSRASWLNRFRFGVELMLLRGGVYHLLLAAAIILIVAVVAGTLRVILVSDITHADESVWWAFLRLSDPGYLGDDEGLVNRAISTVVTVLGYVFFLALLVAILTQWMNKMIEKLESGLTPVFVSNHILLLGWTYRTPTIVAELLCSRNKGSVKRFLKRNEADALRIVILAENVNAEMARVLKTRLGDLWNDRQVLLRSGTPLHIQDLERVAFREAAVLMVLGADSIDKDLEAIDSQTVMTLVSVSRNLSEDRSRLPLAVAELYDGSRAEIANLAYNGNSEVLAVDEFISRIIAQSVIYRGLCDVFSELLALNRGNTIFIRKIEGLAGCRFGVLRTAFSKAIPLGTVRAGGTHLQLNPSLETVLTEEDLLVYIAHRFDDGQADRPMSSDDLVTVSPLPSVPISNRRILILGWSRKVPSLLRELDCYGEQAFEIDIVSPVKFPDRENLLTRRGVDASRDRIQLIEADYMIPSVLKELQPQDYDHIILLASERIKVEEKVDATRMMTNLMLRGMFSEKGPSPETFIELLDDENAFLFDEFKDDVIVSPTLVCYLLSQVALRRELGAVFQACSRFGGPQIVLHNAVDYLNTEGSVSFKDIARAAAARKEIALGLQHNDGTSAVLELNPDRSNRWDLQADDRIVILMSDS